MIETPLFKNCSFPCTDGQLLKYHVILLEASFYFCKTHFKWSHFNVSSRLLYYGYSHFQVVVVITANQSLNKLVLSTYEKLSEMQIVT